MNIAYIISQYPAISHTFIQREILALREQGFTITTISVRKPNPAELLTQVDKDEAARTHVLLPANLFTLLAAFFVPLFTTPRSFFKTLKTAWNLHRPGLKGILWSLFYFAEALLVHRITKQQNITHFHAHFANVATDVALLAATLQIENGEGRKSKIENGTFSFTMHGPTEFSDVFTHRLAEKAHAARFIICISDFARSQLMALLPPDQWTKLHIVHCAVDPLEYAQIENPKARIKNLLCVARLAPVKAHALLLHALDELTLRGHDVYLTLAGDGPSRQSLEHLADSLGLRPRINFLGNVASDHIPDLLARSDLFVLPSFAEGVPVVLMEAMAAGCPVIATRIAGIPELIEDNFTGLLVPAGRADLLANAIERLIVAPHLARRLAAAARQKIVRDFNLFTTGPQLARIFTAHLSAAPVLSVDRRVVIDARSRARETIKSESSPNVSERSPKREKVQ